MRACGVGYARSRKWLACGHGPVEDGRVRGTPYQSVVPHRSVLVPAYMRPTVLAGTGKAGRAEGTPRSSLLTVQRTRGAGPDTDDRSFFGMCGGVAEFARIQWG